MNDLSKPGGSAARQAAKIHEGFANVAARHVHKKNNLSKTKNNEIAMRSKLLANQCDNRWPTTRQPLQAKTIKLQ